MENKSKSINVNNVYKKHKNKNILNNVTFEAKKGRITAFLGPNGAGKSSTLRILLGLDRAISGTATFGNQKCSDLTFPLQSVGAAFDGIGGIPSRKVITHLRIIAKSNNIPNNHISKVLDIVDLSNKSNSQLGTLSLGEGQRLGIAIALLGNPQYIVLDEPTNGLDPIGIKWFRNFIRKQANIGKTILLSSHYLSEIESIADDVVIINNGEIVAMGTLREVMQSIESLEEVFFSLTEGGK